MKGRRRIVKTHRLGALAAASALALVLSPVAALPSGAADPSPAEPGPTSADEVNPKARWTTRPHRSFSMQGAPASTARTAYFVRFKGAGAADAARQAGGGSRGVTAARSRRAQVNRTASGVLAAAKRVDAGAASIFTVANAVPAAGLLLDGAGLRAVASSSRVAAVTPLVRKTAEMQSVDSLVKAVNTWRFSGNTGKGVTIGIVDTGTDYTHADFGGVGTMAAFDAADATDTSPAWLQKLPKKAKAKFAGGYDFSGDDYDGDGDLGSPIPSPDNNPLDCNGHGSHVSGIAAGYGVNNGKPLKSTKYRKLNAKKLMKLDIGPGIAPRAKLYPLRVFGCEGSTYLDIPAYDRALDPNGDGDFGDHLDIINASLGSDYGPQDDPSNDVINEIASHGVVPALSIGNNGDLTDTGGSSGNATASIASASSVDKLELLDQLKVNAPAAVAGTKPGQMSVAYDWVRNGPTGAPVTGTVATLTEADNLDGCDPLNAADAARVAGKVAWLEWDDNDATRRCGSVARSLNVKNAGAIGAIFTSTLETFNAGITGDPDIPVFQLLRSVSDALRPHAAAGTLNVTFDGRLQATFQRVTPSLTDTISGFTSRGPRGSLPGTVVKPDVSAPGDSIGSAQVGSGSGVLNISGTSMASPATAGTAALVKAAHPRWSPLRIKAAIMNTARHDLFTGPNRTGHRYGPARVGAGRLDVKAAVSTKLLAWTVGPNNPVTAGFGVVQARIDGGMVTRTKKVKVKNLNKKTVKVKVRYESLVSQPGVSYSVSRSKLKLRQGQTKTVKMRMTVNPAQLRHTIDPTMETEQLGVPRQYVSDSSGRLLVRQKGKKAHRVPVYGAAKPTSATSTALAGDDLVVSGAGFASGTGPTDWRSLLSVTELGGQDAVMAPCAPGEDPAQELVDDDCAGNTTDRGSDIQYVGAGANDEFLWFAMSTHTDWTNLVLHSPEFSFDVDGDDTADYASFVTFAEATDVFVAVTVSLDEECDPETEVCEDVQPINFNFGDVDTNIYDTNVVLLPVSKEVVGLDGPGSQPITYEGASWNAWYGDYTDIGPMVEFDAGTPNIATAEPLYLDMGGRTIPLTGTRADDATALVVHLHGARGARTELVAVPAVP
jgi:subtilisin family serine protease